MAIHTLDCLPKGYSDALPLLREAQEDTSQDVRREGIQTALWLEFPREILEPTLARWLPARQEPGSGLNHEEWIWVESAATRPAARILQGWTGRATKVAIPDSQA